MSPPLRLAMWSGPRNISTAMMRSFENRTDTVVVDEPFYACYLAGTGLGHPAREEVLASQSQDWRQVAVELTGPVAGGTSVFYQKHMTHHILPDMELDFIGGLTNCFLVRDPARVIASYHKIRASFDLQELGIPQQWEIFERAADIAGEPPPVLDAADVLANPQRILSLLCERVGIGFDLKMLSWPAGPRPSDGVWAPYWYDSVNASTGFTAPADRSVDIPARLEDMLGQAGEIYDRMSPYTLV